MPFPTLALTAVFALLQQPAVTEWIEAGVRETWRDVPHEKDILASGVVLQDLRA